MSMGSIGAKKMIDNPRYKKILSADSVEERN
jgi:hypothetical protein